MLRILRAQDGEIVSQRGPRRREAGAERRRRDRRRRAAHRPDVSRGGQGRFVLVAFEQVRVASNRPRECGADDLGPVKRWSHVGLHPQIIIEDIRKRFVATHKNIKI